ncbi:uncharacterized protein LOC106999277 [Macaca mulatta]
MVPRVQTQSPRLPGQGRTAVLKPRPTHGWPVRAKDVHDVILKAQPWTDTQASVLPTIQPTQAAGYFLLVRLILCCFTSHCLFLCSSYCLEHCSFSIFYSIYSGSARLSARPTVDLPILDVSYKWSNTTHDLL